jgi:NAD(P)-dependent dehydrogenase (short-subunit alcohol dehydrogenase family)/1-acyl-sn-glycerol-3-phosphate acyltransferase
LELAWSSAPTCLLTNDGTSTTTALAKQLVEQGWKVVILNFPTIAIAQTWPHNISQARLAEFSESELKQQLTAIADNYGAISAFIHLHPQDEKGLETGLEKNLLKSVFLIAKHLKKSLNEAAQLGRSFFVTVTRFDGILGLERSSIEGEAPHSPSVSDKTLKSVISGGLFGLTKTLNMEWERVFCRAIDLNPKLGPDICAQLITAELHDPNLLLTEVGYNLRQERTTLVIDDRRTQNRERSKNHRLNAQSVFLVSGGGRGITAQCVIKLAKAFQCKFILLGRTKRTAEPAYTQGCVDENELKQRIIKNFQAQGEKPTPVKIQKLLKAILAQREIDETLQAIVQAGGQAEYLSADITKAAALAEQLTAAVEGRNVLERFGPITGLIHGAGVLADKLIEKKTESDFEAVYSTKIDGLQSMLACIDANQLDNIVLFSSAAGFYGNIGQSDYSIANEILNKFAYDFKRQHPACHVVSFNWGPWDGGMVTPQLKQMFAQRNIEVIPIEVGTQIVVDYLKTSVPQAMQVLVGSPFTTPERQLEPDLQTHRIRRKLTLAANPFLQDHVIGETAVLPTTCASAWLANTCQLLYPGYQFLSCEDYKVLKGIVFDETLANEYIIDLKEVQKSQAEIDLATTIWSETATGKPRYHYTNRVKLVSQPPATPDYNAYDNTTDEALAKLSPYQDGTLFHGPGFQGVKRVLNISPEKLTMECVLSPIDEKQQGQFPAQAFNPIAADIQFQCMLIWVRHFFKAGSLPLRCQKGEHFLAVPEGETFYVSMEVQSSTDTKLIANITSHDHQGQIYSRVFGAEVTISKQLNHLFVPSSVHDPKAFLPFWRNFLNHWKPWVGEILLTGLFRRFVGQVVRENWADFNAIKNQPVLYLANHQVGVESILFGFSVSALAESPINVVAKAEHRNTWVGQLLTNLYSYPTLKDPELMFYFERDNQSAMLEILNKIKQIMIQQKRSLLVHVDGTRAFSSRQPIKNLSAIFIDLAIELNIPIVPVAFVGGLPIEPVETRLEFPIGYTRQNYHLGTAISPEILKKLPNAERKRLILERINQLANTTNSSPNAPNHPFEQAVHQWMKQTGISEVPAVLYKVLEEEATALDIDEVHTLLQGIREGHLDMSDSPENRWLRQLGQWLSESQMK